MFDYYINRTYVLLEEESVMESLKHKKYRIVSKKRFYLFLTTILVLAFIVFYSFKVDAGRASEVKTDAVYVSSGDTLWSLSKKYVSNRMDIREYIDEVIEYNNLQSINIKPGQLIYMPIYNK